MFRLRVPASSANLGPGFDALGLALDVYLECRFSLSDQLVITVSGRDVSNIPTTQENLVWQTASDVARRLGTSLPQLRLHIHNDIPLGRGLGSSAAALTAGVVIANTVLNLGWNRFQVLDEAARLEGHPDNVGASVLGSIVASAFDGNGVWAIRLEIPSAFNIGVVVPNFTLPTSTARAVLPDTYSRDQAVFNVQRAALLIAALATGTTVAFPATLEDALHQPFRAALIPGLREALSLRAPGLLGCALSGAGPSVLVFYENGWQRTCELVRSVFQSNGYEAEILPTAVASSGYELAEFQDSA